MARITGVDALRGVAIVMMIAYHFVFDLDFFGLANINLFDLPWLLFQRSIGTLFMLLVGVSLTLSESNNKEGYRRHLRRGLILGALALLITLGTWIYPHEGFITFGVIHSIAAATLIAPFFFRLGWMNIPLGIGIILVGLYTCSIQIDSHYFFWLGLPYRGYTALDYYPLMPWFGVVLIGVYAGQRLFPGGKSTIKFAVQPLLLNGLAFLGRNSLTIYFVHQAVLVGAMLLYKMLF